MQFYKANASVVYTTAEGKQIDTFVIFDTDVATGLTHINYENLKVPAIQLTLHAKTVGDYHLPFNDSFSFELFKELREKYAHPEPTTEKRSVMHVLALAS